MNLDLDRSAWRHVRLDEVVENHNDYYSRARQGDLPYVAGPHIAPGVATVVGYGSTADDDFPPTFKRCFQPGDVLLHSRGIEKIACADRSGVTGEKLFVLRTRDPGALDQRFLVWALRSPTAGQYMRDHFTGSVNKFLNWKPLASMKIALPPLEEQRRVANLMWAVERHRSLLARLRDAADNAVRATTDAALEGLSAAVFRPSTEVIREMTVGVVVKPTQYYTEAEDGIPALRGLNIVPGGFVLDDLVHFDPAASASLVRSTLREGDVVVVRTGRPGDAATVTKEVAGANCIDLIIVRPGDDLLPEFLTRFLNSSFGRVQVMRRSAGTAQQHFNVGALKKVRIPTPPLAVQREVVERIRDVEDVRSAIKAEQSALASVSTALVAGIFGGTR